MGAVDSWREPLAVVVEGERTARLRPVGGREVPPVVNVACTDQSLLLPRLCRLLHERPELRFISVASQLDEGNLWCV
jgi:hypothetical protein